MAAKNRHIKSSERAAVSAVSKLPLKKYARLDIALPGSTINLSYRFGSTVNE